MKKKIILAVLLFAALLFISIILPMILRKEKEPSKDKSAVLTEIQELADAPASEPSAPAVSYKGFEALDTFVTESQIAELKELFPSYLQTLDILKEVTVTFLEDKTTYPSSREVKLCFRLSDQQELSVYYDTTGRFLFGDEKLLLSEDTATYPKETDKALQNFSIDEIEKRQEGGYPDTAPQPEPSTAPATESEVE